MVQSENIDKSTSWPWIAEHREQTEGGWGFSLLLMSDFTLAWSAASGCVLHTGTPGCYWSACKNPVICPAQFCPSNCKESESWHHPQARAATLKNTKTNQRGQNVCKLAIKTVRAIHFSSKRLSCPFSWCSHNDLELSDMVKESTTNVYFHFLVKTFLRSLVCMQVFFFFFFNFA